MSMLRGYPSLERGIAFGLMPGPSADVEFIRIDLTPRTAHPSSHRLAISTPSLRWVSSGPARFVGALFEMCWHLTPVSDIFAASLSSHFLPDGLIGSNPRVNMLSSVTSPNSPEKRSMCVTPGKLSFVNCGKSSMVISPYFSFICAFVRPAFAFGCCPPPLPPPAPA